jgi:hypothetical protein
MGVGELAAAVLLAIVGVYAYVILMVCVIAGTVALLLAIVSAAVGSTEDGLDKDEEEG